jgi:hypothetical protein
VDAKPFVINSIPLDSLVIACAAKQSSFPLESPWIASSLRSSQ